MVFWKRKTGVLVLLQAMLWVGLMAAGCSFAAHQQPEDEVQAVAGEEKTLPRQDTLPEKPAPMHPLAQKMVELGMVDVQQVDPSLLVDLKYGTKDNFMGKDLYQGLKRAFLQPEVAHMLARAQELLHRQAPSYSLLVYDAARPRSVQQQMFDAVDAPFSEKIKFLSNPANGSVHNFGAAVDVTIADSTGTPLDMGTPYDYMGQLAYPGMEDELLAAGRLTPRQVANRRLLRKVMRQAGFSGIRTEWWHFNAMPRSEARRRYPILE